MPYQFGSDKIQRKTKFADVEYLEPPPRGDFETLSDFLFYIEMKTGQYEFKENNIETKDSLFHMDIIKD